MTRTSPQYWISKGFRSLGLAIAGAALFAGAALPQTANAKERYALVIANKDYTHTGPVRFAFRDAAAIEKALVDTMGVPPQNIIFEKNLSKGALEYWFGTTSEPGQLATRVTGEDSELIVYFAGHGSKYDAEGLPKPIPFLLGTDTRPEALRRTGYSLNTLKANLRKIKKDRLPRGRVMLVLESCFSGGSNDGDLIVGRSAPAFGRPTAVITKTEEKVDNFVILAAAQGDQFAVWDNKWERSVFTDALVSGLYGEADDTRFEGNNDGAVTLGELQKFVSKRIERRLRATGVTSRQDPVINGQADLAIVKTSETDGVWPALVERSGNEKLESDILMQSRDVAGIQDYLNNCLYCFNQLQLKKIVRDVQQSATICSIEERWLKNVSGKSALRKLEAYLKTARCERLRPQAERQLVKVRRLERRAKLKERRRLAKAAQLAAQERAEAEAELRREEAELARLEEKEERERKAKEKAERLAAEKEKKKQKLASLNTANDASEDVVAEDPAVKKLTPKQQRQARYLLTRRLQTELKRVGCLTGRVDGVWGRGSDWALDRFVKTAGVDVVGAIPSEEAIETVASIETVVCKAPAKKTIVKKKTWKNKKASTTNRVTKPKTNNWKPKPKTKKTWTKKKSRTRTKTTTYVAPKKTYKKKTYTKKKTYSAPKKTYSGGSSGGGVTLERQCSRYGNFC